jgi:hypothetical protein
MGAIRIGTLPAPYFGAGWVSPDGSDPTSDSGNAVAVNDVWFRGSLSAPPAPFTPFEAGTVQPSGLLDAGTRNVGPRLDALQIHEGDINLTSGMVLQGLDIHGRVTTATSTFATPPIVRDCIIRGKPGATSQRAMAVGHSYDFGGTLFEWCRFDGTGTESLWQDCINGGNYTLRYCELMRGVDGLGMNTVGNATVEACRIYRGHYASYWSDAAGASRTATFTDFGGHVIPAPFPVHASGDVHSDGAQIQGWSGWVIRGCYIGGQRAVDASHTNLDPTVQADYEIVQALDADAGFANSAIIVNATGLAGQTTGALIEKNWLEGGAARINLSTKGSDLLAGVTVRDNRFIRSTWPGSPGFYLYVQSGHAATLSNNTFADTGAAVPVNVF